MLFLLLLLLLLYCVEVSCSNQFTTRFSYSFHLYNTYRVSKRIIALKVADSKWERKEKKTVITCTHICCSKIKTEPIENIQDKLNALEKIKSKQKLFKNGNKMLHKWKRNSLKTKNNKKKIKIK